MTNIDLANTIFPNIKHDIFYYENKYPNRELEKNANVTRFAPSPTGFIHMGSLFTAFIASKVATDTNGIFYLRIEDTDQKRSVENGIENIIKDLNSFNIKIDEGMISNDESRGSYGPYLQSQRLKIYHTYAKYLIEQDLAYPCFCTKENLDEMRSIQEKNKERIGYYGKYAKCRNLTIDEMIEKINNNEPYVIRLKSRGNFNEKVEFNDLVRGKITFPENDLDCIIIKEDKFPPYHFAHVIDDHLMHTTTVIRGEEWLSSTPIHIQLFKYFKFDIPKYAHLGLINKIDEFNVLRKLSKRKDKEAAINYYYQLGIPLEAVKLYLLTLANSNFESWLDQNKNSSINLFKFDFKRVSKSGSLFDINKLLNISKNYLSLLKSEEIYENTLKWANNCDNYFYNILLNNKDTFIKTFSIEKYQKKPRKDYSCYSEIKENTWYMIDELFDINDENYPMLHNNSQMCTILKDYMDNYYNDNDDEDTWYEKIKLLCEKYNYACNVKQYKENSLNYNGHIGDICELIRISVTKRTNTPNLYDILKILNKSTVEKRINIFIKSL